MPSFGGKVKLPRTLDRRLRRNVSRMMGGSPTLWLGDGLELTGAGLIAIDLAANPGLEFTAGDIRVRIVAAGGILRGATGLYADLTVLVPYVGATAQVDLGVYDLVCDHVNITDGADGYQVSGVRIFSNEGTDNIWVGAGTGASLTTGSKDVAVGDDAGTAITSGYDDVCIGYRAGYSLADGYENCLVGASAGLNLSSGDQSVCFGAYAGRDLTTGTQNTLLGYAAGLETDTGFQNTIIGCTAGFNNTGYRNTLIGFAAGHTGTSHHDNIFIGWQCGLNITNGQENILIGQSAAPTLTVGDFNTLIGHGSDVAAANQWGGIALGYHAVVAAHQVVIGGDHAGSYIDDVYLGRGVTSATPGDVGVHATGGLGDNIAGADLEIAGGQSTGNAVGGSVEFYTSPAGAPGAGVNALVLQMTVDENGDVGIGVADPHSKLEVNGAISSETATLALAGPTDDYDVSGINTLFLDCSANNVVVGGFVGGVAGQVLHIARLCAGAFNGTLEHNEGTGNQDIFLHAMADESLNTEYGGWVLVCDGSHWYDLSHSKHV